VALGNADWALYAPLFALGASVPVYILGLAFSTLRGPQTRAL
jgi:hypothetical protein